LPLANLTSLYSCQESNCILQVKASRHDAKSEKDEYEGYSQEWSILVLFGRVQKIP
jgi:hypothetical protein